MAMRMSGLMSGMDTETIIKELVSAKQTKVDDAKKAQTKLQWKQDAWKELNTKLKNLQAKYIANMRPRPVSSPAHRSRLPMGEV